MRPDAAVRTTSNKRRNMEPLLCPACGSRSFQAVRLLQHMERCCPDLLQQDGLATALGQLADGQSACLAEQPPPQQQAPPPPQQQQPTILPEETARLQQLLQAAAEQEAHLQRLALRAKYTGSMALPPALDNGGAEAAEPLPQQLTPEAVAQIMQLSVPRRAGVAASCLAAPRALRAAARTAHAAATPLRPPQ